MKKPTLNDRWLWILETVHIPLWLVKDLCWLLTWKTLGVIMAIPTVLVAIIITVVSYQDKKRFLPNISIAFWIIANANWMVAEFFDLPTKFYSIIPFSIGIAVFVWFLISRIKIKKTQ